MTTGPRGEFAGDLLRAERAGEDTDGNGVAGETFRAQLLVAAAGDILVRLKRPRLCEVAVRVTVSDESTDPDPSGPCLSGDPIATVPVYGFQGGPSAPPRWSVAGATHGTARRSPTTTGVPSDCLP
ncbi:hypothetical protein L6V77_05080 [Myxococcota bacterium]|nr:hypothetical protein [Myxococcota bacterium]